MQYRAVALFEHEQSVGHIGAQVFDDEPAVGVAPGRTPVGAAQAFGVRPAGGGQVGALQRLAGFVEDPAPDPASA